MQYIGGTQPATTFGRRHDLGQPLVAPVPLTLGLSFEIKGTLAEAGSAFTTMQSAHLLTFGSTQFEGLYNIIGVPIIFAKPVGTSF